MSVCSAGEILQTVLTCHADGSAAPQPAYSPLAPAGDAALGLIAVKTAVYRTSASALDFVYRLRALCDHKARCALANATDLLQGDPILRQSGQFSIIYGCVTGRGTADTKQAVFGRGAAMLLSCRE